MKAEQTLLIESILVRYHRLVRMGRIRKVVGFHSKVAHRFGVSSGRVTNIARGLGLTGRKPKAQVPRREGEVRWVE